MTKQASLERSLHILGPVLGRKRGVQVRIGGRRACTDGNTIWLPALPIDDAEAAALGFGLLFHETNHLRYTDFTVARGDGLVAALTNVLEDIRIDGLGQQEYRGGRREGEELVAALIRRGEAKTCADGDRPGRILESYVMWRLEFAVLGIGAAQGMAEQAERVFGRTFAPELKTKLDALMFEIRGCRSTLEVQQLAGSIAQMLDDEASAQAIPPTTRGEQVERARATASPLRQALNAAAEDHATGIGELAQAALNAKGREGRTSNLPMPRGTPSRIVPRLADAAPFVQEVAAATNALRQRLAGLLQAETLCRRYPTTSGSRIDTRRLGRIEAGDARIFLRAAAGLKTDTAVQILVDRSGSMGSSRGADKSEARRPIEMARASCYAAALALSHVPGIAVAAAAFPGDGEEEVAVMARFHQRVDRQASRFAALEAGGGTPMAEAMLWAAGELLGQPKPRRIVLVATDGACQCELVRAMAARLDDAAIETLAIGIHCEVSHLFVRSRPIVTIAELPQAMFELLAGAIRRPSPG